MFHIIASVLLGFAVCFELVLIVSAVRLFPYGRTNLRELEAGVDKRLRELEAAKRLHDGTTTAKGIDFAIAYPTLAPYYFKKWLRGDN